MEQVAILIAGIVLGSIIAWFVVKAKFSGEVGRVGERAAGFEGQLAEAKTALAAERDSTAELRERVASAETVNRGLQEKFETQKAELEQLQQRLTTEFENLANRILDEKSRKFTEQNRENIDGILKPLNEKLGDFKKKVEETYEKEARDRTSLQGEIKQLFELNQRISKEANSLTSALKGDSKTQGNWGEMILETILEKSGLEKGREYLIQESRGTDEGGRVRPDVIINMPDKRNMIIDSKVSLKAYESYCSAEDADDRTSFLKEHVNSIRNHIRNLGAKNYQTAYGINSPDFVLMFMPVEPAFALAANADEDLFRDAFDKRIVIVSPSTLLATLKTVENIWRQEKANRNAMQIAQQAGALYDKFAGFLDDMKKIGSQLNTVQRTYSDAMGKLDQGRGSLISKVQGLKELGAKTSKSLPEVTDTITDVVTDDASPVQGN